MWIYTRSLQPLNQGKQTVGKKDIYHGLIGELLVSWNCPAPENKTIARFQVQISGGYHQGLGKNNVCVEFLKVVINGSLSNRNCHLWEF